MKRFYLTTWNIFYILSLMINIEKLKTVKQNARVAFMMLANIVNPETMVVEINGHPASLIEVYVYLNYKGGKFNYTMTDLLYANMIAMVSTSKANLYILNPDFLFVEKETPIVQFVRHGIFGEMNLDKMNKKDTKQRRAVKNTALEIMQARIRKIVKEL